MNSNAYPGFVIVQSNTVYIDITYMHIHLIICASICVEKWKRDGNSWQQSQQAWGLSRCILWPPNFNWRKLANPCKSDCAVERLFSASSCHTCQSRVGQVCKQLDTIATSFCRKTLKLVGRTMLLEAILWVGRVGWVPAGSVEMKSMPHFSVFTTDSLHICWHQGHV